MNKIYITVVVLLTLVLPLVLFFAESQLDHSPLDFADFGKWFIFFAVGIRLLLAGVRQTANPAFTAREIFHIDGKESFPIIRELGFANLCFGLVGVLSLFFPAWRVVSAFASGLYYGMAGFLHIVRKPENVNEQVALWSDLLIFVILLFYFVRMI